MARAEQKRNESPPALSVSLPPSWPESAREAFLERASIKEFMGNMPRLQAEQEAKAEIEQMLKRESAGLFK
jgi:hypothetical protein